jgi:hypothetical protein
MTDNPEFPDPSPSLETVTAATDAVEAASASVLTRRKGAREARDAKVAALRDQLRHLQAYVQEVADGDPAMGASIIEAAGMTPKRPSLRNKQPFAVTDGAVSGSVRLVARAQGDRIAYAWFQSLDQKTWTNIRQTIQANTVVTDLTPGLLYFFQLRTTTLHGPGWVSDVVSLLVR